MQNVTKTVSVLTGTWGRCEDCGENGHLLKGTIDESINHYLGHGYRLLHVGTQSGFAAEGEVWHNTVAVLGK